MAAALSTLDLIALGGRAYCYVKSIRAGAERFSATGCWAAVVLDRERDARGVGPEYANLVSEDPEEYDAAELKARAIEDGDASDPIHVRRAAPVAPIDTALSPRSSSDEDGQWANDAVPRHNPYPQSAASERTVFDHSPRGSIHSDETLHEAVQRTSWKSMSKTAILKKIGRGLFATTERALVFAGYMQTITGIVIYTGGCRENFVNGCLAHLISAYFYIPCRSHADISLCSQRAAFSGRTEWSLSPGSWDPSRNSGGRGTALR